MMVSRFDGGATQPQNTEHHNAEYHRQDHQAQDRPAQPRQRTRQRGIDVSYETVRRWSIKFGLAYAKTLRQAHPRADTRWHLDEVFVKINGKCVYLWRAVDCEGEVLDVLVQSRRNKRAAMKLMRKLLKSQGFCPTAIVTDKLPSYGAVSYTHLTLPTILRV